MSSAGMNRNSQMLRRIVAPARAQERQDWCPSCKKIIEPQVDSGGRFCPWCQQDIPTAMERGREHTT